MARIMPSESVSSDRTDSGVSRADSCRVHVGNERALRSTATCICKLRRSSPPICSAIDGGNHRLGSETNGVLAQVVELAGLLRDAGDINREHAHDAVS